jgi:hypothetical protein
MIVIDRSGSMNDNNKIDAARKAAGLLANELADADQGGLAVFQEFGILRLGLGLLGAGPASHREALEAAIAAEPALGGTSIGSGLVVAADEQDAHGLATHACAFVLLSDGMEIEEPHWDQVQAGVIDNGCPIHAIALGPEADEGLMQQIAGAVPGGSYDFADTSGSIPVSGAPGGPLAARRGRPAQATTLIWQNNLARVYDYKAVEIAGRQRIQTWAETGHGEFTFYVDDLADQLVIGLAWQNPGQGPVEVVLLDPNGDPAQAVRRLSSLGTNEVWEVANPIAGDWMLIVEHSNEEYVVNVSLLSDYEMYLFTGAPIGQLTQGVQVPILVGLVSSLGPLTGASVTATVRAPNGQAQTLTLHDDGAHLDGEAGDGIYGNLYTATGQADVTDPNALEGQEPKIVGSYQVTGVALWNLLRREARTSFAIAPGPDADGDGLPDDWEAIFGVDDPTADDDGDGLDNECEYNLGTDPQNSDTDGGGQSDGSEAPECNLALQDPFDPEDDLVGQVALVKATPQSDGQPYVLVQWSPPLAGSLAHADLWRRLAVPGRAGQWVLLAPGIREFQYVDNDVQAGTEYEYRLVPYINPPVASAAGALQTEVMGAVVESGLVTAAADPYPPLGTIWIDNGAATTADLLVALSLSASDSLDLPAGAPSTATDQLEMQISNSPDFAGAAWVPFQPEVQDWNLGPADPGDIITVYVQFKDPAGNVGGGPNAFASILYQPGGNLIYLPYIQR